MFSIAIPLYNKEKSITKTLKSVLDQTYQNFEVIIVNDGSTDASIAEVNKISDPRIRLIHQKNAGVSVARNKGIQEAKYNWIAFLDADDLWKNNHLESLNELIQNFNKYKVFCTSYTRSKFTNDESMSENEVRIVEDYFSEVLKYQFVWTGVVCLNKCVINKVGFFNSNLSMGEDLDLWMRVGRNYDIVWSKKITALYNQESENKITNKKELLHSSLIYTFNFKNKHKSEITYLKRTVISKIKFFILQRRYLDAFKLITKYNFNLL